MRRRPTLFVVAAVIRRIHTWGVRRSHRPEAACPRRREGHGVAVCLRDADVGGVDRVWRRASSGPVARAVFAFPERLGYQRITVPPEATPRKAYLVFLPNSVPAGADSRRRDGLPDGASWISAPLSGTASVAPYFPKFVAQAEGLNAQLLLDEITWGTESVSRVSEPVIDHVPLSRSTGSRST